MVNEQNSVPYRSGDYLTNPEACAHYLEAALDDGDEQVLLLALRNVADAMRNSEDCGALSTLFQSGSDIQHPQLSTLLKVLHALGFELTVRPKRAV